MIRARTTTIAALVATVVATGCGPTAAPPTIHPPISTANWVTCEMPDGEHVWAGGATLYSSGVPAHRSCTSDEAARAIALFSAAQLHREELERKERSYRSIYIPTLRPRTYYPRTLNQIERELDREFDAPLPGPHLVHCDNWGNGDAMCEDM